MSTPIPGLGNKKEDGMSYATSGEISIEGSNINPIITKEENEIKGIKKLKDSIRKGIDEEEKTKNKLESFDNNNLQIDKDASYIQGNEGGDVGIINMNNEKLISPYLNKFFTSKAYFILRLVEIFFGVALIILAYFFYMKSDKKIFLLVWNGIICFLCIADVLLKGMAMGCCMKEFNLEIFLEYFIIFSGGAIFPLCMLLEKDKMFFIFCYCVGGLSIIKCIISLVFMKKHSMIDQIKRKNIEEIIRFDSVIYDNNRIKNNNMEQKFAVELTKSSNNIKQGIEENNDKTKGMNKLYEENDIE